MTPNEKAIALRDSFLPILGGIEKKDWIYFHGEEAKQCALVVVNELIEVMKGIDTDYSFGCGYYQQVKHELEKL